MALASLPTATTLWVWLSTATTEGSLRTIPWPFTCTTVFAVPRSIATSLENQLVMFFIFVPVPPPAREGPSTVPAGLQALEPAVADDHVVEQADPHEITAALQAPGELDVLAARLRVAGGMVVGHHQGSGAGLDRRLQHLARVHQGSRQGADRHRHHVDHLILRRQQHRDEMLAVQIAQRRL